MKLSNLTGYLEHELNYKRFDNMLLSLNPYVEFKEGNVLSDMIAIISKLSTELGGDKPDIETIRASINKLTIVINAHGMSDFEPDLLHKPIEVFNLKNPNTNKIALIFKETIIYQAILQVLKLFFPLVKSYSKRYYLKDIIEENIIAVTDYQDLSTVLNKNVFPEQIIYIDFRKCNSILPVLVKDLEGCRARNGTNG